MVSRRVRIATLASIHVKVLEQTTSCSSSPHSPRVVSSSSSTGPILRKACWSCGAQICPDCASNHTLSYAAAFHNMNCYPNCSRCFTRKYCGKHIFWRASDGYGGGVKIRGSRINGSLNGALGMGQDREWEMQPQRTPTAEDTIIGITPK